MGNGGAVLLSVAMPVAVLGLEIVQLVTGSWQ